MTLTHTTHVRPRDFHEFFEQRDLEPCTSNHPMGSRSKSKSNAANAKHSMVLRQRTVATSLTLTSSNRKRTPIHPTTTMLQAQREMLHILEQKVIFLKAENLSLERKLEEDTAARVIDYQCSICLEMAWSPYVTMCGHCFCSRCLSQYKAEHMRKRLDDPDGTEVIIRCPTCRRYIFRKPQRSLAIEDGVAQMAIKLDCQ
ncbi:hypothetical protein C8J55DRAFT_518956 [Lentinula edodes]|uniref:RING-type domain-containing protein n=1 Tax=Lentinula lateritia TaxID=40482 RepID=A0A9W9A555_9AGAR|nr:hypothetical protein C8J55DRAFT_518956 [Lentinula edodes]